MFTLAISCLTTSNLPWFMELTFQVPIQYCSLQPWTSLLSQVTSTTGHCSHFCSASSFFSGAFSPLLFSSILGTYWLGGVTSFCLFILFMGFSREEYWSSLPFPSPVDHVLLELSTMTLPFWVALQGMTHSFTELDKAVCDQWSVWLIFCSYFSTDLQKYIGHLFTWALHLFAFSYCSWHSQCKNTEVVWHSLLQWTMFC